MACFVPSRGGSSAVTGLQARNCSLGVVWSLRRQKGFVSKELAGSRASRCLLVTSLTVLDIFSRGRGYRIVEVDDHQFSLNRVLGCVVSNLLLFIPHTLEVARDKHRQPEALIHAD